ncbi:carbamoyltransferase HypF [Caldanaerobius polysaccharolyticus]|uniref:carbamoyltransferase HypF n=1 Tax=Caldanaerobius polysaccharolyticus TaxID=44256 RepID=UPI000478DC6D|nr:carbamoyltransferase HypF [Caldanaerobius polysaccharolyticus]
MRKKIYVYGIVQGVGFRPFIYNLSKKLGIRGYIKNTSYGVYIDAQGSPEALEELLDEIKRNPPLLSVIQSVKVVELREKDYSDFKIVQSQDDGGFLPVSPDMGICDECLAELFDRGNRRYRYPFINCTNCGPRYSIIKDIPYDRPMTTMARFAMCPDCQREYNNPSDRRFHAQPNACAVCGPRVSWVDCNGQDFLLFGEDAVKKAVNFLKKGRIVAIKGVGGFNLAVDATDEEAVKRLRERKHRYEKPLAVMAADVNAVRSFAEVSPAEEKLLASQRRPIVLLKKRPGTTCIAPSVAPGVDTIGVMLPPAPLHYLIACDFGRPLVMTSGNLSEEPIAKDNDEALERLKGIADGLLIHDRDIFARIDDSVAMVVDGEEVLIRRARGYAPQPILYQAWLNKSQKPPKSLQVIAVGPHDKVTVCLARDGYFFVSQHIGDMESIKTFEYFQETIERYKKLFRIKPEIIAYDMHPDYITTQYAEAAKDLKKIAVQHHHAHIVSCMVDSGLSGKVIGVAYDGTGYGDDGRLWGGEIMIADLGGYSRYYHLKYIPLIGGASAIKKIYKTGLAYMFESGSDFKLFEQSIDQKELCLLKAQWEKRINAPEVSSMGRLFDAVAAVLGIRHYVSYEGQAAAQLESLIDEKASGYYEYSIESDPLGQGKGVINPVNTVVSAYRDLEAGEPLGAIALRFHNSIVRFTVDAVERVGRLTGVLDVVLTGGVFQNRYLLSNIKSQLKSKGFNVYVHSKVPCNDGGISLGQAAIAYFKGLSK